MKQQFQYPLLEEEQKKRSRILWTAPNDAGIWEFIHCPQVLRCNAEQYQDGGELMKTISRRREINCSENRIEN